MSAMSHGVETRLGRYGSGGHEEEEAGTGNKSTHGVKGKDDS